MCSGNLKPRLALWRGSLQRGHLGGWKLRAISRRSGRVPHVGAIVLAVVSLAGVAGLTRLSGATPVLASSSPWPAVVDAQGHSDTTVEVMWTPVPGASSYSVYRDQGSAPVATTQATIYDDPAGAPSTTYSYRVTATSSGVESLPSATATATTQAPHDSTPPTSVGIVIVSSITSSSAMISWGQSSDNVGIEGYRIYRGAPGDPVSSLKDIDTTDAVASYQPTKLLAGTGYQFGIQALDAAGNLSAVKTVSFTTATASPGSAPQPPPSSSIIPTPFSSSRIDVTWGTSSGASLYQVRRDGAVIGSVAVPDRLRFSDNGLAATSTHSYTIVAVSSTGVQSTVSAAKSATTLASGTVRVARGPYVMSVTQNSAKLAWWTNLPTPAVATVGPAGSASTFSDPTSQYEHVILVGPLAAGTAYPYVVGNGSVSASGSFTTPAPPGTPFSFAAIGDYGGNAPGETQNASLIAGEGTQLIQTLGDNIYPEAADPNFVTTLSDYDTRFYKQFRSALSGQVFSPANGNKEYYGNGAWFQHMWLPNNEQWYSYDRGDAHVLVLDTEQPFTAGTPQYLFAQGDLASHQSAAWRIVVMQRPPYSSTSANSSSIPARSQLVPLFQSQHVQLVLSGNSHNYERTFPLIDGSAAAGGTTYIVSGAGGNGFNVFSGTAPAYSAFRESSFYEHLRISVSPTSLQLDAIRADTGAVFDSAAITASTPTTGAVSGTVTSASGGATISGATVTDRGGATTTTNGSGAYTLSGLTPGSHNLTASAPGYSTSQPQTASVTTGQTTPGVNFSLTPAVSSTPQLVQATGAIETTASTSLTANFSNPTSAGHLLVLSAGIYTGATSPITSVTDSGGNTWTKIGAFSVPGHYSDGEMWYVANAKAATSVVIRTTGSVVAAMALQEFSGVATTSPLDVSTGTSNTSTAASSGSMMPTASTDLVVGFVAGHNNAQAISVGAGYSAQAQQTSSAAGASTASVVTGYKVLTSASAQTFTGSFTTAMYWAAGIATFKAGP
jgi:fibronectin type 3 domain-containing protein